MKIKCRHLAIIPFIVIAFQACSNSPSQSEAEATIDTASPALEQFSATSVLENLHIKDTAGKPLDMASLKGKKVFINLWASWCPPCKVEMPSIQKLYDQTDLGKVVFILLSLDNETDHDKALAFMKENKLTLPIYFPNDMLPPLFNVQGIPATFIFDEQGQLIERIDGMADFDQPRFLNLLSSI